MLIATTYILVAIAAIMNAMMDRTENIVAFNRSVFSHLDQKFWCKEISWQYVKFLPLTKYRPDAWHLAKSIMIVSLLSAIATGINYYWHLPILFVLWNATFNIFYNRILKR